MTQDEIDDLLNEGLDVEAGEDEGQEAEQAEVPQIYMVIAGERITITEKEKAALVKHLKAYVNEMGSAHGFGTRVAEALEGFN
jgi:hypothetical protein